MDTDHIVVAAPTYVAQLEQALALAREHLDEMGRRHETAEMASAQEIQQLLQRIHWLTNRVAWLEAIVAKDVVVKSKPTGAKSL